MARRRDEATRVTQDAPAWVTQDAPAWVIPARPAGPVTHAARHRRETRRSWMRLDELSGLLDAHTPRVPHRLARRGRLEHSG